MNLRLRSILFLKENSKEITVRFIFAVSLIALFIAALPLFSVNCIQGHDIDYHLLRIEALKTGILNGLPYLRVNMLFFGGEGYASSMFYPDFLLYIPAVLRALGVGINLSFHIFIAVCLILTFIVMYLSAGYISESPVTALISAVVYSLCQYHIDDIYTRAAVGEFTAMIFIPAVIAGLFDLTEKEFKKPWILGVGMAGVLLCHTLSTIFCLILCVVTVMIRFRVFVKEPVRILKVMLTGVSVLCLTAFYWIPMLEQVAVTEFKYLDSVFDVNYEKLLLRDVFANSVGHMGIAVFILLFAGLLIEHKGDKIVRTADIMMAAGLLFALCTTGFFPWKRLERFVSSVQFPWRLFIMTSVLISMAAAVYISKASVNREKAAVIAVLMIMTVSAVSNINRIDEGYYSYSSDYYDEVKFTKSVIGGEWLPRTVTDRDALGREPDIAVNDRGDKIYVDRYKNTLSVSKAAGEYIDVPFVYYLGYAAVDSYGKSLNVDGTGKNGRVRVWTDGAGEFTVYYKGTFMQTFSDIISILTLIILAGCGIIRKVTWRKAT